MESNKQEKYNLLHDNPVAKTASGDRSFMSKHTHGSIGSPLHKRPDQTELSKPSGKNPSPQLPTESVS